MNIPIPEKLERKLSIDSLLHGAVLASKSEIEPLIAASGMPFFPEYTDHGPEHLGSVLQTETLLIPEGAWEVLGPADAAILILATLLHDCAMHLREDGFISLVKLREHRPTIRGFDDVPWDVLWNNFLAEAKRFDGKKLKALFGNTEPVHSPVLDRDAMTGRDRKLIGEFLRRHHPRLAHEIALYGVPGPELEKLRLKDVPQDLADLAGVIARSHGLPLRSCLEYLSEKYHLRDYKGVHAVFLMTLLRVSDYLQIQAERAPMSLNLVFRPTSPTSQRERDVHQAVRNISYSNDDPKAVYVQADPRDVRAYLRLREWLDGIQSELDESWAVLGEVYGRFDSLDRLGLIIRRVKSNLDDRRRFAERAPFIPCRAAFETADAELLKLLIHPLYGERPEIGIRELIQNSVDAVRELWELQKQRPELNRIELPEQEADVVVSLDEGPDGSHWITVRDRGIGMTAEVVRDYFLRAGASFRKSDYFRRRFESHTGKSVVLRSGRFGVGAIAAFLLGDELQVETRHVEVAPEEGIQFRATLDDDLVELRRLRRPVGTTIRIKISLDVKKRLQEKPDVWDWYVLSSPTVIRYVPFGPGPNPQKLSQRYELPSPPSRSTPRWVRMDHPQYEAIYWGYSDDAPHLSCNGIIVYEEPKPEPGTLRADPLWTGTSYELYQTDLGDTFFPPRVSVFDPDGNLPLNLQRTSVTTESHPFHAELREDVLRAFLAFALRHAPQAPLLQDHDAYWQVKYRGLRRNQSERIAPWFSTPSGVCFFDRSLIRASGIRSALILPDSGTRLVSAGKSPAPAFACKVERIRGMYDQGEGKIYAGYHALQLRIGLRLKGLRIWVEKGQEPTPLDDLDPEIEEEVANWTL